MANPEIINCPKDTWTKIANSVTTGIVYPDFQVVKYLITYVDTGDPIPSGTKLGIPIHTYATIGASENIDVYIYPLNRDGSVWVGIP